MQRGSRRKQPNGAVKRQDAQSDKYPVHALLQVILLSNPALLVRLGHVRGLGFWFPMRRHRSHQIVKQVVAQDHIEAVVGRRWRETTGRVTIQGVGQNPSNGAGGINCSIPCQQQQGNRGLQEKAQGYGWVCDALAGTGLQRSLRGTRLPPDSLQSNHSGRATRPNPGRSEG